MLEYYMLGSSRLCHEAFASCLAEGLVCFSNGLF